MRKFGTCKELRQLNSMHMIELLLSIIIELRAVRNDIETDDH